MARARQDYIFASRRSNCKIKVRWQPVGKVGRTRRVRLGGQEVLTNHGRTGPVRPTF